MPTKSGLIGLLAAALGRRRSDPIEDLVELSLAVRSDQPGRLLKDFHTAHHQMTGKSMPLTDRFYWSDAVFVAAIEGPDALVEGLAGAVADPEFPLYLGRRSCVPEGRLSLGIREGGAADALTDIPWQAGTAERRRRRRERSVRLSVQADACVFPDLVPSAEIADVPISFDPSHRQYRTRMVVQTSAVVENDQFVDDGFPAAVTPVSHDPMSALEAD